MKWIKNTIDKIYIYINKIYKKKNTINLINTIIKLARIT